MSLRIATRGSGLALKQTQRVAELISQISPEIELETLVVSTAGDRDQKTSIQELGGQGVFVTDVQSAVLAGKADIAVHSAKDLPAETTPGLVLASVPERADPRDALVACFWNDLPKGALIATGSIRRRSHLAHLRPDLKFQELRGNIETRLSRSDDVDAVVVAVPAEVVVQTIEDCASKNVGAAVIFSSGFAEQDEKGRILQEQLFVNTLWYHSE